MIVENLGDGRAGAFSARTSCNPAFERGVELATMFDDTTDGRASLRRLSDVTIDIASHLVASPVAHILVLGWFVPQLRLTAARATERDIQRHVGCDGVGQRINLDVITLVFVVVRRRLALLRMAQLV